MSKPQDKKKLIVVGALAVCVLGIGAFQFIGGGSSEPKKSATKKSKSDSKHRSTLKTEKSSHGAPSSASPDTRADSAKGTDVNATHSPAGEAHSETAAIENVEKSGATPVPADPSKTTVTESLSASEPARDPFEVPLVARKPDTKKVVPNPVTPPATPAVAANRPQPTGTRIPGGRRIAPMPIEGLPPVDGSNPTGPIAQNGPSTAGVKLQPGKVLRNEDEFAYSASGVVLGSQPMAVLKSDDGKQRLVRVGSSLGGGRVIAITSNGVVIDHRGKKITLKVGGDSEKGQ